MMIMILKVSPFHIPIPIGLLLEPSSQIHFAYMLSQGRTHFFKSVLHNR